MIIDQGIERVVFGIGHNGSIETTEGRPQEGEGEFRVYTSGYAVLSRADLIKLGRWCLEHERRHDD